MSRHAATAATGDVVTFAGGESVTIQTAGTIADAYSGDPVAAWNLPSGQTWITEPTETTVPNVLVGSGGSTEPLEVARNEVASDFDLIFQPPLTTVPTAQNRVIVRGLTCEVDGRGFAWRWPGSGSEAGMVVRCSVREG